MTTGTSIGQHDSKFKKPQRIFTKPEVVLSLCQSLFWTCF